MSYVLCEQNICVECLQNRSTHWMLAELTSNRIMKLIHMQALAYYSAQFYDTNRNVKHFFCCHWSSVKGMVKARKSIDWKYFRNVLPVYRTTALQLWWFTLDNSIMEINSISSCTSYPFLLCHLSSSSRSLIRYVWRWFEFHTRAHNFHQLQNKCTIYISMVAHYPAIINSILCTITHTHIP